MLHAIACRHGRVQADASIPAAASWRRCTIGECSHVPLPAWRLPAQRGIGQATATTPTADQPAAGFLLPSFLLQHEAARHQPTRGHGRAERRPGPALHASHAASRPSSASSASRGGRGAGGADHAAPGGPPVLRRVDPSAGANSHQLPPRPDPLTRDPACPTNSSLPAGPGLERALPARGGAGGGSCRRQRSTRLLLSHSPHHGKRCWLRHTLPRRGTHH